ncbi:MAG: glutamine--fructose-6-phosphate transaminase (isomerizing) [Acidobacteria bacterium]|nr:glutamine--fructose-6-phosphate transaminase (isomerizing) [Acidobacteriota bacterium]MCA1611323.1 glutamine--fructose-6-phosphate transaminase (isomerizing) [Acidobacteriota bacterium]
MCGIVGYVGSQEAAPLLLEGLKRLEYRGYDSAGIATLSNGTFEIHRAPGKLGRLVEKLGAATSVGKTGIGHTRWATHGRPTEGNAHPHRDCSGEIVVVHNGIFENFAERKAELLAEGHRFTSETDTEVFAHEVEAAFHGDLLEAVRVAARRLTGAYAVVVSSSREPGVLVTTRSGPPIVLGLGAGENFVASDPVALVPWTRDVVFLEDGDLARVDASSVRLVDGDGAALVRAPQRILWDAVAAEKAGYRHFMLKEIHEQPTAIAETLGGKVALDSGELLIDSPLLTSERVAGFDRVLLLACGTSWHSALIGKFLIEGMARIPVEVDYGSEFRYRLPVVDAKTLTLGISQSGETADTVAALSEARRQGAPIGAIVNAPGSQIARMADAVFPTHAGPEIGVASTKAFTTQLAVLFLLAARLREARGLGEGLTAGEREALSALPRALKDTLQLEPRMEELARKFHGARDFLFLGRGLHYPVALEGALKLKEISYIHAEGYPAGEMKHGPIALVDESLPVVVLAPHDRWREKTLSNLREVKSRDGVSIVVTTREDDEVRSLADDVIVLPETIPELQPIVSIIPLQLLAYHIAVRRGCDVDQPRNLAKSVTVE